MQTEHSFRIAVGVDVLIPATIAPMLLARAG